MFKIHIRYRIQNTLPSICVLIVLCFQTLGDPPAVNIVIGKSGTEIESSSPYEQQKLASQRPRGTRLDPTGRIKIQEL